MLKEDLMANTELVRADKLVAGDHLGHLPEDVITSVKNQPGVTIVTLATPRGPRFSEVPPEQLIRIMVR
jgi:hypothetical protein